MADNESLSSTPAEAKPRKDDTWVQCDRCSKWRRVPQTLADGLDEDAHWYCEHNPNKGFASCNIPQELSNDEIDKQLADSEEDDLKHVSRKARQRPQVWQLIRENIYTHRAPKLQDEDDVMLCHCKLLPDGSPGCGPDCLNRVLNMECVPGFCPCGNRCSNQQFSKRQYAKLEKRRAGAKGFGLFALEDLKAGQFIIEYIGEVLEEEEYLRRKEYYQDSGQRHYYFMNIGNGEVIDAARKGALGRFINHSCAPNCETQKWVVRGELAIGLYALEDIPAGTELTFDYNFERYGDKPMRCLCESKMCRGFIGGTGESTAVENGDLEDPADASNDPEPIMLETAEAERDPALIAVLESEVGLAPEYWDSTVWRRLEQLAVKKGLDTDWVAARQRRGHATGLGPLAGDSDGEDSTSSGDRGTETIVTLTRSDAYSGATSGTGRAGAGVGAGAQRKAERAAQQAQQRAKQAAAAKRADSPTAAAAAMVPPRKRLMQRAPSLPRADALERKPTIGAGLQQRRLSAGAPPRGGTGWQPWKGVRRRSEVDRRLDSLVGPNGRLRDGSTAAVVRMLRLFNLCDVGPSLTQADVAAPNGGGGGVPAAARKQAPRLGSASPDVLPPAAAAVAPMEVDESGPAKAADAGAAAALLEERRASSASASPSRSSAAGKASAQSSPRRPAASGAAATDRDSPLGGGRGGAGTGRARSRSRERSASRERTSARDREDGEIATREADSGAAAPAAPPAPRTTTMELSARQRARMADLSLLLDVILKTVAGAARREFCRCGVLHQLQAVYARCVGPQYSVIVRKMLRAVEALPFSPDDLYTASSAHGSFGDVLSQLAHSPDTEIRSRAAGLLKRFPLAACSPDVLSAAEAARSARRCRAGRKRFGGRYTGVFWADCNSRGGGAAHATPRAARFNNAGHPLLAGARPRPMRTPRISHFSDAPFSPSFGGAPPPAFMSPLHQALLPPPHQNLPGPPPPAPAGVGTPNLENGHHPHAAAPAAPPLLHLPDGLFSPANSALPGPPPLLGIAAGRAGSGRLPHGRPRGSTSTFAAPFEEPAIRHKRSFSDLSAAPNTSSSLPPGIGHGGAHASGIIGLGSPGTPVPPPLLDAFGSGGGGSFSAAAAQLSDGLRPPEWDAAAAGGFEPQRSNGLRSYGFAAALEPPPVFSPRQRPSSGGCVRGAINGTHLQAYANSGSRLRGAAAAAWALPVDGGGSVPSSWDGAPAAAVSVHARPPLKHAQQQQQEQLPVAIPERDGELADLLEATAGEGGVAWEDAWEEPGARFRAWVQDCVLRTLGRYCRPSAPDALKREEAVWAFRKAVRVIVDNEQKAYAERQRAHAPKPIDRRKLEPRIGDYIRDTIKVLIEKRDTT